MDIQYRDGYDSRVMLKDPSDSNYYYKEYLIDGVIKKTEEYYNSTLVAARYYKSEGEQDEQVISLYDGIATIETVHIMSMREGYGSYAIEVEHIYMRDDESGVLKREPYFVRSLYDAKNNCIATEVYDNTGADPVRIKIGKYYHFGFFSNGCRDCFEVIFEDQIFTCITYNPAEPEYDDGQDIEEYRLEKGLAWMKGLGISEKLRNWYVSSDFFPPI